MQGKFWGMDFVQDIAQVLNDGADNIVEGGNSAK